MFATHHAVDGGNHKRSASTNNWLRHERRWRRAPGSHNYLIVAIAAISQKTPFPNAGHDTHHKFAATRWQPLIELDFFLFHNTSEV